MKLWAGALGIAAICGFAFYARTQLGQQPDGSYLVSSGQRVELLGKAIRLEGKRPKDLALSPDKSVVALLTHRSVALFDLAGNLKSEAPVNAAPLGIAWATDGKTVYASEGSGKIASFVWDGAALAKPTEITPATGGNLGTCGLAAGPDGTLYAALSIRNEVVALVPDGQVKQTWKVGACPYHLAISPDGKVLSVANRGGTIIAPPAEQGDPNNRGAFQGTGVAHASSAGTPVQIDPRTDVALVGTVSLIRLGASSEPTTIAVGRQPSGMTFSANGKTLYVANSDEDTISLVDITQQRELGRVALAPKDDPSFGQIPTSVALSPDEKRIYVALGGGNSIAVIDNGAKPKVAGYFPTAWYPIALATSGDQLFVGCSKGIGSRPASKTTGFGVHDSVGIYQSFALSEVSDLREMTKRVAKNNGWTSTPGPRKGRAPVAIPERIGESSVFKHVVYIIKENLTYDAAMGDIKTGNGDPSLCTYPEEASPNHHALARRFGLLDNFYISGTNSADGHQWVDSSIANDYTEQNYGANQRSYPYDGGDPLAFSPAGFLWTQAKAAGKSVRVFGEFVDKPSVIDLKTGKAPDWKRCWEDYKSGKGEVEIKSGSSQAALRSILDPIYIGFPSSVSDQWRADRFIGEFKKWEETDAMPDLTMMLLPNDHTVGTRSGWPTPRAAVADNDLALGRIIEAISRSKFWKETLIIVAEDDSQNGLDHVDGHRSICFCISPYSRKEATIEDTITHVSIASTIGHVLGVPPMTRFDRVGRPMTGCFTDAPDFTPYTVVPNRVPLDEVSPPAKSAGSAEARQLAEACNRMDWDEVDTQNQDILNRAIWQREAPRSLGRAGFALKYPGRKFDPEDDD